MKKTILSLGSILFLLVALFPAWSAAQQTLPTRPPAAAPGASPRGAAPHPLETLLNADGTLDLGTGFSDSLAASGWAMALDAGGQPHFSRPQQGLLPAPTVAGDENWLAAFALGVSAPGTIGLFSVSTIAVSGSDVYVGGQFTQAGDVPASYIARWSNATHTWSALGSGVDNWVETIAVSGNNVYVGGHFYHAGGVASTCIAIWNATSGTWSGLAGGVGNSTYSPQVSAIAVASNGDVYVGGSFDSAGGVAAMNVARWDGSAWHALGSGAGNINNGVYAVATSGTDLYAGGSFTSAGGGLVNNVALWDGSTWSALGDGVGGFYSEVYALAVDGSAVYVGGAFSTVTDGGGTHAAGHVAMWNGSSWSTMAGGVGDPDVTALAVGPDGVYVGGRFTDAGGAPASRIARWDGSAWQTLQNSSIFTDGVDNNVYALAVDGNDVYVGGFLLNSGGYYANHIARWNVTDAQWYGLGNSVNGAVNVVAVSGDYVYVGGDFTSAGGIPARSIARWNVMSHAWSTLGGGWVEGCGGLFCNPNVYAIAISGADVYIGGDFGSAGGTPVGAVTAWNSTYNIWLTLGGGVSCSGFFCSHYVTALAIGPGGAGVFAGGVFETAGGTTVNNVAYWDGSTWHALDDGVDNGTNGGVAALAADPYGDVYVGGDFADVGNHIKYWNVFFWSSLGSGVSGPVAALAYSGMTLTVGGNFTTAGGIAANNVATWNEGSSSWQPLGSGVNKTVQALAVGGDGLYVGGYFTAAGALGASHVARWDGTAWSALGSGTDQPIIGLAATPGAVYAGGRFRNAGDKPSFSVGRWGRYTAALPLTYKRSTGARR